MIGLCGLLLVAVGGWVPGAEAKAPREFESAGIVRKVTPEVLEVDSAEGPLQFRAGEMPIGIAPGLEPGDGVKVWYTLRPENGGAVRVARRITRTTTERAGRVPPDDQPHALPSGAPVIDDRAFFDARREKTLQMTGTSVARLTHDESVFLLRED